ncbi:MAG: nucleoside monophosphate kinase [Candidatus Pacebacteria bacterium]|nr:nucleoside monophosphate kinase [Candidatus Paceibacterota bacterium]
MEGIVNKQVVILVGPPGSGKDTQAERLVQEFGFVQVPSSRIIRTKFAENPNDPVIQEEKRKFDSGLLNDPVLVGEWIMEFVRPLAEAGKSLVFSGSPRTPHEAQVEYQALIELFGLRRIMLIYLDIDVEEAKRRIAGRRFCQLNGHVVSGAPEFSHLVVCPQDGSVLAPRALDVASLIPTRYNEFNTLTLPVVEIAKTFAITDFHLDGKKAIEGVHHDIAEILERRHMPVSEM